MIGIHPSRAAFAAFLAALIGLAPVAAFAATLAGRVADAESGEPMPFASVVVRSAEVQTGVITDEIGQFELLDLPPGDYTVSFFFIGYADLERRITLLDASRRTLTVRLEPEAIEIERVEVRADRLDSPRQGIGTVRLSREQIRGIPSFGEVDPIRTLQFLPGVQTASDISSGLYVRGGGPDQTLVLLDGTPIYNPTHAFGLFSTFNADAVGDVTLHKGAYPARYGGRLGSVLDVRSREGDRDEVRGRAGISVVAGRFALEGPVRGGTWSIAARRTYLDPVLSQLRKSEPGIPSYYFYDGNARVVIPTPGRPGTIAITGFIAQDDLSNEFDAGFFEQRWGNRAGSVKYETLLGASLLGSATLSAGRYVSDTQVEIFATPFRFTNRLRDLSLRGELSWDGDRHHITSGVEGTLYRFALDQSFNGVDDALVEETPSDLSWFVEDAWEGGGRLDLTPGFRLRRYSEGGRVLAEPRLLAEIALTERLRLKAGGGVYHQYVQLVATEGFSGGDFYVPLDDTVEPGRSMQTVAGLAWNPTERWGFSLEGYATTLENLILVDNDNAEGGESTIADAFKTGGEGWATGVELFAEKKTGVVRGWVGYTLGWTRRRFDDVNGGREFPPKYDRRHDLNVVSTWDRGPWQYGASFVLGSGQAFTPAAARYGIRNPATGVYAEDGLVLASEKNSGRLLPYHRIDVSVARDFTLFGKAAEWNVQVFNLYSRRNEWFVQYNTEDPTVSPEVVKQLPILPTVGVSFEF